VDKKASEQKKKTLLPDRGPDLVSAAVASTSAAALAATAVAVESAAIAGVKTSAAAAPRLPPVAVAVVICATAVGAAGVTAGVG
jgi:hypothetical protein